MANVISNIKDGAGLYAKGMAQHVRDNLKLCAFVEKEDASIFDGKNGYKSGDTFNVNIPAIKTAQRDNLDITSSSSDVVETTKKVTLNKTATDFDKFDSLELATEMDVKNALKRFGMSSALALAHDIESRCMEIVKNSTYQLSGTAGSNAFETSDILDAKTILDESLCPNADRALFMTSRSGAKAVDARKAYQNPGSQISKQYTDGYILSADGFDWIETQMLPTHLNGTDTDPAAVNGTVAEGAVTLPIDALGAGTDTVTEGTVFTIAGVNKVHPQTKADLGVAQQFVVTADASAVGGAVTLSISPAIYAGSGGLQNVTALPADDAVVTFGTGAASTGFTQNLALHKSAFKMVTVPLYQPQGVDLVASETVDGITVNIVRDFDVRTREVITRYDVLYAFDEVRPEWSTRITA